MAEIKIKPLIGNPNLNNVINPNNNKLFKRTKENEDKNNWTEICSADSVYGGNNGFYSFGNLCTINNMGQFYLATKVNTNQIIPVHLLNFTAQNIQNTKVQLDWQSITEINLAQYEIEHSTDSINFTQIAIQSPLSAISDTTRTYQYEHLNPSVGNNFYRLKMKSTDGTFEYSVIRKVIILVNDLTLFEATALYNDSVQLHWQMATEINVNRYEIEHSTDNLNFSTIGQVIPNSPNSTTIRNYYFTHQTPIVGYNYYRIKIISLNGNSEYSNVESVEIHKSELNSFEVEAIQNQYIKIDWQMTKEVNVDKYDLEHSLDSLNFTTQNTQTPVISTNLNGANYTYNHQNIIIGKHYYRLKISTLDGNTEYSTIKWAEIEDSTSIGINTINNQPIKLYPNPSKNRKIEIHLGNSHSGRLYLYNVKGKLVKDVLLQTNKNKIDFNSLATGTYYYSIITDLKIQNGKLFLGK